MRLPWVSIAPLGRPVVPPVYCSSATSSADDLPATAPAAVAPSAKLPEGDDAGSSGIGACGVADLAPIVVLADDQAIEQSLVQKLQRRRQQRRRLLVTSSVRRNPSALCDSAISAVERR